MDRPELWGGHECTVNRVGETYLDQSRLSGHHDRDDDLDRFAALGISALRYPLLWERVSPEAAGAADWRWTDRRLARLRTLGIRPIAGLVHHGSGPRHTHLLDDGFATGLAAHAGAVAHRYPWIEEWTPVNEPLTTARFSALYGHWYPHARDEGLFWRALLNQIDGTRLAMRAIRRINPAARLIQTDDLGRSYATIRLAEQAAFDNLRRWAGWDLLFGMVTPHHPLWHRIARHGLAERLERIADDPCPPDVVGVNHYLTSDRFLDHRLQRYPPRTHGGNGRMAYADVEAVRVLEPAPAGLRGVLREAWKRYGTPLAVTEVHNGCTREEQMRWAAQAWDDAVALRREGVDVRGVTAWALLGSHGWNTLLTAPGRYETGVFDVAGGAALRPTALASLWRGLPADAPRHPVAAQPGWWRRPERLLYPPVAHPAPLPDRTVPDASPVLLLCGPAGGMRAALERACLARALRTAIVVDPACGPVPDNAWGAIDTLGWPATARACAAHGIGYAHVVAGDDVDAALDRLIDATAELDAHHPVGTIRRGPVQPAAGGPSSSLRIAATIEPASTGFSMRSARANRSGSAHRS